MSTAVLKGILSLSEASKASCSEPDTDFGDVSPEKQERLEAEAKAAAKDTCNNERKQVIHLSDIIMFNFLGIVGIYIGILCKNQGFTTASLTIL